ncbi:MAG: hypothetical protein ABII88_01495 [Candidatus Omnitrophota bacterium]
MKISLENIYKTAGISAVVLLTQLLVISSVAFADDSAALAPFIRMDTDSIQTSFESKSYIELTPSYPEALLSQLIQEINRNGAAVEVTTRILDYLDGISRNIDYYGKKGLHPKVKQHIMALLSNPHGIRHYAIKVRLLRLLEKAMLFENADRIKEERKAHLQARRATAFDRDSKRMYILEQRYAIAEVMALVQDAWEENIHSPQPKPFELFASGMAGYILSDDCLGLSLEQRIRFYVSLVYLRTNYVLIKHYAGNSADYNSWSPYKMLEAMTGVRLEYGLKAVRFLPERPFGVYFEFKNKASYLDFEDLYNENNDLTQTIGNFKPWLTACFGYSDDPQLHELQHAFFSAVAVPLRDQVDYESSGKVLDDYEKIFIEHLKKKRFGAARAVLHNLMGDLLSELTDEFMARMVEGGQLSEQWTFNFYAERFGKVTAGKNIKGKEGILPRIRRAMEEILIDPDELDQMQVFYSREYEKVRTAIKNRELLAKYVIDQEGNVKGMAFLHMFPLSQYDRLLFYYDKKIEIQNITKSIDEFLAAENQWQSSENKLGVVYERRSEFKVKSDRPSEFESFQDLSEHYNEEWGKNPEYHELGIQARGLRAETARARALAEEHKRKAISALMIKIMNIGEQETEAFTYWMQYQPQKNKRFPSYRLAQLFSPRMLLPENSEVAFLTERVLIDILKIPYADIQMAKGNPVTEETIASEAGEDNPFQVFRDESAVGHERKIAASGEAQPMINGRVPEFTYREILIVNRSI